MLKHLKPRDILETLLFLVCFIALFAFAGYLETAPLGISLWMAGGLAVVLWIVYIVVVARQRHQEQNQPTLWMAVNGYWVAQDGSGRSFPMQKTVQPIFDQDQKDLHS